MMWLRRSSWLALGLWAAACGAPPCPSDASEAPGAPVITELDLAYQMPGDPWSVILATAFSDSGADLYGGEISFFIDGKATGVSYALADLFRQSGLPQQATAGEFGVQLRFTEGTPDGARTWLAAQLIDEAQQRSNCYALELSFAVSAVDAAQ